MQSSLGDDAPADCIQMSILPDVDLELVPVVPFGRQSSSSNAVTFNVVGPERPLQVLRTLSESVGLSDSEVLCCKMSPLAPVTVPADFREGAGIPLEAHTFAYIYPWAGEHVKSLNFARDSWAFVMLLGGFAYFSSDGVLMSVNVCFDC